MAYPDAKLTPFGRWLLVHCATAIARVPRTHEMVRAGRLTTRRT